MNKSVPYDQLFFDQPDQANPALDNVASQIKQKLSSIIEDADSLVQDFIEIYKETNNGQLVHHLSMLTKIHNFDKEDPLAL